MLKNKVGKKSIKKGRKTNDQSQPTKLQSKSWDRDNPIKNKLKQIMNLISQSTQF